MAYIPIHPSQPVYRPGSITFDEYKERNWYYMGYEGYGTEPKEPPPLVICSMFWECAGVYTVYVLSCVLIYLLVG